MKNIFFATFLLVSNYFVMVSQDKIKCNINCSFLEKKVDTAYFSNYGLYVLETNLPNGEWCVLYNNNQLYASYKIINAKLVGRVNYYWPNGNPFIVETYKEGLLDGEKRNYHPSGVISVKSYWELGKRVGLWKFYDDKGRIIKRIKGTDPSLGG